jgi:branched-chain amino acid transport system substrate-binding protein
LRVRGALSSAILLCLVSSAACSTAGPGILSAGQIHIGVDLPLTGPEAVGALPALNGIRFFVEQHQRLDGYDISLVTSDDAAGGTPNPQLGAAHMLSFIADPDLLAVIGPFDSAVARAEIPPANAAALAMISPATSSPCLTRDVYLPALLSPARVAVTCKEVGLPSAADLRPSRLNNYFRLTTTDDLQGPAAADYAFRSLRVLRAAVVSDHESYGQALADAFTARFQKLGGSVVGRLDVDPAAGADVGAFLHQAKASGATALYYGGASAARGCAVRAEMAGVFDPGEASPFLSGDGIAGDPACIEQAGSNSPGVYATVPAVDAGSSATATQTIAAFKAVFGRTEDYGPYTMSAYDATAILYAAIDRAVRAAGGRLPPRGNVLSQLSITADFPGVTGTIGFDPAGDTTQRIVSVFEPGGADPRAPWKLVDAVDYSKTLPY